MEEGWDGVWKRKEVSRRRKGGRWREAWSLEEKWDPVWEGWGQQEEGMSMKEGWGLEGGWDPVFQHTWRDDCILRYGLLTMFQP